MNILELIALSKEKKEGLIYLNLSEKHIDSLDEATFIALCAAIVQCENLNQLDVGSNNLSGLNSNRWLMLCESISKCKNLQQLFLYKNDFSRLNKDNLKILCTMVSQFENLETLYLNYNNLGARLVVVCEAISGCKKIRKLFLYDNDLDFLGNSDLERFCSAITQFENLEELNIGSNNLGAFNKINFEMLFIAISKCKNLKNLDISVNFLDRLLSNPDIGDPKTIWNTIFQTKNLQQLSLYGNNLGLLNEACLTSFCTAISICKNLQELNFGFNFNGNQHNTCFEMVCTTFSGFENLELLDFEHNYLGNLNVTCFEAFCHMIISRNKTFQRLRLGKNNLNLLNDDLLKMFYTAISKCTNLQELDLHANNLNSLSDNNIRMEIFSNIIISQSKTLKRLDFTNNELSAWNNTSLLLLFSAIAKCTQLQELYIGSSSDSNSWNEFAFRDLRIILSGCTTLQKLDLGYTEFNELDEFYFKNFCDTLSHYCKNLRKLSLSDSDLGDLNDNNFQIFCDAISYCINLKKLNLKVTGAFEDSFPITPERMKKIENIIQKNNALSFLRGERGSKIEPASLVFFASKYIGNNPNHFPTDGEGLAALPLELQESIKNYRKNLP